MKKLNIKNVLIILAIISTMNLVSNLFNTTKINKLENKMDKIEKLVIDDDTTYLGTYNTILPKIRKFNPEASISTIKRLAKVMHYYSLDKTANMTNMYVGQILQESGASQYFKTGHPQEGKLMVSSGGAIGIAQILPSTAYGYLTRIISKVDKEEMLKLGCTDFSFVYNTKTTDKLNKVGVWLKKEKNNVVLWGYIVKDLYKRSKDVEASLVSYNAGIGGMQMYLDSGNVLSNHEYIVSIKNKLSGL